MNIPEECHTKEFWAKMRTRARTMLQHGYRFRGEYRSFSRHLYDDDLIELANDLVNDTWIAVRNKPEPEEGIRKWVAFFHWQLLSQLQSRQRNIERRPPHTSLEAPISYLSTESGEVRPLDIIAAPQTEPSYDRWTKWAVHVERARSEMLEAARREMYRLMRTRNIRNTGQVSAFLDAVQRYLREPLLGFDTHRKRVAQLDSNTPSRSTAARWWDDLRETLPMTIEQYKRLATGEIE